MKYLLFAGDKYYPSGGWHDCRGAFESILAAMKAAVEGQYDWWHVVELQHGDGKIVEFGKGPYYL
jgi:hypothetical protein